MDIIVLRYLCTWRRTSWRSLRPDERRTRGVARRPSDREHLWEDGTRQKAKGP